MGKKVAASIFDHFKVITDPRIDRNKLHNLTEIIVISICAAICGAEGFEDIEEFGKSSESWLRTFLELKFGIPSHDTFRRVFILLNPEEFKRCFLSWINAVSKVTNGDIIPIDGKALRRSYDNKSNKAAIHMVSAWSNANSLVLGQVKVDDKSNEITAIPELLRLLHLKGCIVTIDAIGCQKKIVKQICSQGGDYIIALKKNQGKLYEQTEEYFNKAEQVNFNGIDHENYTAEEQSHGRNEKRDYRLVTNMEWLTDKDDWTELNSIGMVISTRTVDSKTTIEKRYYISSLTTGIKEFARGVRSHWGIENKLHWVLDVQMREDESRIRTGNAPENFAMLRHVALNLLRQEKTVTRGIKGKKLKAALDVKYREKVLFDN